MDLGEAPCQELKYLLWFLYKLSPATGVSGLMTPPRGATDDLPLPAGIDHAIANAQGVGLGVQGGWRRRAAVPGSAPHGGAQHGPRRRAGARRDGSQWPPDAERLLLADMRNRRILNRPPAVSGTRSLAPTSVAPPPRGADSSPPRW